MLTFKELKWFVKEYEDTFPDETVICIPGENDEAEQADSIGILNELDIHFRLCEPKILIKRRG